MTEQMTNRNRWLALIIVCLGSLMIVLDVTIVGVALPSIREDLGFSESALAWVANAYLLTFGGFLLLAGRLGDLFGRRAAVALAERLGIEVTYLPGAHGGWGSDPQEFADCVDKLLRA
jgi:MFS family permease